jgi:hypothetical protein
LLVFLTFIGMVGLYIGLYMAYLKWEQYAPTIQADVAAAQNATSSVTGLLKTLVPSI